MTDLISVIAPNLNEEKHLATFLNSLVAQTFKDFEVIIVDGGSKDRSQEIIWSFENKLNLLLIEDHKRNFGYIRNVGAKYANGTIFFHTCTDTFFKPRLLEKLNNFYREHPETISVSGRTYPLGTSIIAHLGYQAFDFLRFIFTCAPMPIRKYRPSGNFMSCRKWVFNFVGGYPEATVNEDGLMGQKLDQFSHLHRAVVFHLGFFVGHHVKKFESMGGIKALLFYFYTLGNLFPLLKPLLKPIEYKASVVFEGKTLQKVSLKTLLGMFWEWL